jgi:hypothetical protein
MTRTNWLLAGVIAFLSVPGGGIPASGQQPKIDLPVNEATSYKGEEFLLIGNAVRGAGEPTIAINPKNPNNIIVSGMANLHYVEGQPPWGVAGQMVSQNTIIPYRNTPGASISIYAISNDRGRTWRFIEDEYREADKMNGTADAFTGVGADGTMFIGAMSFFPMNATDEMKKNEADPGLLYGYTDISLSKDEGKTWSKPIHVMGHYTKPEEYAPGVKPGVRGTTPYDRPFIESDLSTGTIYVPGNGTGGDPVHRETFFRASRDYGKTWGLIYTFDSPDYPQGGGAAKPRAAHGVVGVAYVASSVPSNLGAKCPCLVFGASRDEGKTFDRHVVKDGLTTERGFGGFGNPSLAADPSHPGRFAVMTLTAGNSEMQVYVTDDYGKTWKGPVKAGSTPGATIVRPDMNYSPKGELAVMWLAVNPDRTYSCWSAASHDGGSQFSPSLQVSRGVSPARSSIKNRGNNWDGDDLSTLAVDNDYVHIVWADGRAGFLGSWYARIPLAGY